MRKILTKLIFWLSIGFAAAGSPVQAEDLVKPYVLASVGQGDLGSTIVSVKQALSAQGFEVVGEYAPYEDAHIVIATDDELKALAARVEDAIYVVPQRISITRVDAEIQVAYVNPEYLYHAYRMEHDLTGLSRNLEAALGRQETFGGKGMRPEKLRKYHYTFGMEYFDDRYRLAEHKSYEAAVKAVEGGLASGAHGVTRLYRIDIPGRRASIFGVAMNAPTERQRYMDDAFQMKVVDYKELRQTAYLPYEVVVSNNQVEALHMRFRMAVHFPDLRMVGQHSFLKLVSSPEAIQKALTLTVGGTWIGD